MIKYSFYEEILLPKENFTENKFKHLRHITGNKPGSKLFTGIKLVSIFIEKAVKKTNFIYLNGKL